MTRKRINLMNGGTRSVRRGGFTLIELLVVILIILIISAVALPTVIPAVSHRQVSEAARILQGALVGARDAAIHNNGPSGIRLLPDAVLNGINANNALDGTLPLAYNRIIPIEPAPQYIEGLVNVFPPSNRFTNTSSLVYPIPAGNTTLLYPYAGLNGTGVTNGNVLMVEESVVNPNSTPPNQPNSPTSWFWNIRVGDKIQINNSGVWYTVVGPMLQTPFNINAVANTEMFVNVGPPGTVSPLVNGNYNPEFLFVVNGQDDNGNGWTDEGWDNVDNNGNGTTDELLEWEGETWQGAIAKNGVINSPYVIQRRPAPATNAREVSLPTNVVIDATTLLGVPSGSPGGSLERSRLPVNQFTGYVDILVYPNGTLVPTTIYSSPSSFLMGSTFLHFWLAERSDVTAPTFNTASTSNPPGPPYLPIPKGLYPALFSNSAELKGEYRLVTLNARTGQISTAEEVGFDPNATNSTNSSDIATGNYNVSYPFQAAQQGVRGGQ